jgi:DNA-binding CsgD family transcriptional regulator
MDDLVPRSAWDALEATWLELLQYGTVRGPYELELPDGTSPRISFAGVANLLPGKHLIVFVPAAWPDDEFIAPTPLGVTAQLTVRQRHVLQLVARGRTLEDIADQLSLSPMTVSTHIRNALQKLGAHNRAHAIAIAIATGEITP